MPAKIEDKVLTYRDLQIFKKHETEGKTLDKTADEMGISRDTVKRTKKKAAYRDMVLAAMEAEGYGVEQYVQKLVKLTDAKKEISIGGDSIKVDDNTTQMKAIDKIGKVFGDNAPTEVDLTSSLASASDAELFAELEEEFERRGLEAESGEHADGESGPSEEQGRIL